ncbi:twitching motility protein PilT [Pararhizobium polonicum]|uniref:Ribonuclease VapC n=1 Tax=Pararhizobium polonicum TaxID=1612624 RepID=A0A1C7P6Z3_9HYPH|nr:type II toxin-antitoxin system VapC family toxin [Pararhizobium polonicum]OBZ95464.1 twitching motility protein PilT [Pararhizobium polonicum]
MFIDTSVIVALLAGEPEAGNFAGRISAAEARVTSGLVILEASMRLSTMLDLDPLLVESRVRVLLNEAEIGILPIDGTIATASVMAFAAYGKGRGHPAQLNLADCMSYACAKVHGMPLLFKGNDFSKTDITAA